MIRIRHTENSDVVATELSKPYRFVEICDLDGNIGALVFMDDRGTVRLVGPEDPDARRYERMYGVKFSKLTTIPMEKLKG